MCYRSFIQSSEFTSLLCVEPEFPEIGNIGEVLQFCTDPFFHFFCCILTLVAADGIHGPVFGLLTVSGLELQEFKQTIPKPIISR